MIASLRDEGADLSVDADVHVIGGGIAGLIAATRMAARGLKVVVTESGGERQDADTHPLNEVVHSRSVYLGASAGRFRCLGGTSTRWGGAMIPFLPADMEEEGEGAWPIRFADLAAFLPEVERLFGLRSNSYEAPEIGRAADGGRADFVARLAAWPAFRARNVATLLDGALRSANGPRIWLDATACDFRCGPDGRLAAVTAQAENGRRLTVRAREVVIAAGAIESTRLLLLLDRQHQGQIWARDDVLGRYFHDHLSATVAAIEPTDRTRLNRLAGYRFEGKGMRNLRFEPSEAPDVRRRLRPGFAQIYFLSDAGSGFDALREIYRLLQQRRVPGPSVLLPLAGAAPWLLRAAWWRLAERRLLYPPRSPIEVNMVIEQPPRHHNRITLSPDRVDRLGQPLAVIDWSAGEEEAAQLTAMATAFIDYWRSSTLAPLGTITRRAAGEAEAEIANGGGIYHPGGSTRMGLSANTAVLRGDLSTFRVPNLSVAATSAFPSGGGANPTMMLIMAAMRLADRLAEAAH